MKKLLVVGALLLLGTWLMAQDDDESPTAAILGMIGDSYDWSWEMTAPNASPKLVIEDKAVRLEFVPNMAETVPESLGINLTNKSGAAISVNWDQCYTTSLAGKKRTIYHGNFDALPKTQSATKVAAGETLEDALVPRDGVVTEYHKAHWDDEGNWVEAFTEIMNFALFYGPDMPTDNATLDKQKNVAAVKHDVAGKSFKVGLSLTIGGKPVMYETTIRIKDVVLQEGDNPFGKMTKPGQSSQPGSGDDEN